MKKVESLLEYGRFTEIIVKKSVDDAFPGDYGGRSKWDINYLKPWKQLARNEHLRDHIEAQFECCPFLLSKRCLKGTKSNTTPLNEVREIIRAIFYGHYNNSFQLMAVHGVNNPDDPVFFIRIHPPVRFSPHGSPLLLVSVIDYPRLEELIGEGKVDREAFQSDFHRLVTEGVSKEVCIIKASTNEELNLFRYVLRVNSTKMKRSAWQSMKLPRGNDHPWIPTFITPLYDETISNTCDGLEKEVSGANYRFTFRSITSPPWHPHYRKSCAFCYAIKVQLKYCGRCQCIYYCSASCQKSHWSIHKLECSTSLILPR